MKNWQMITIVALILALGAYMFLKDKKKCGCSGSHEETLIEDAEAAE